MIKWTQADEKVMERNLFKEMQRPSHIKQFLNTEGLEHLERPTKDTLVFKFLYRDQETIYLPKYWETIGLN